MRLPALLLFAQWLVLAQPDLGELAEQLENRSCTYSTRAWEVCQIRPLSERVSDSVFGWLYGARMEYECPLGAARCLEKLGPKAAVAVPAMMKVLRDGPNDFDTGDGIIGVRSGVVAALEAARDPLAIQALATALEQRPGQSEPAILQALGSFGQASGGHWKLAADRLWARNRDREFGPSRRSQIEWSMASDLALDEIRRRDPGKTSYVIPNEAIEAARLRIDRGSAAYMKALEARSGDRLAEAAAIALGKMLRSEGVPVLVEAVANPHAAWAAARALGEIGDGSVPVVAALEGGLRSNVLGPRAKTECARALGRLGSAGSLPLMRDMLLRPELAEAGAAAIANLGPAAQPAMPDLRKLAGQPSLAVRNGNSISYSVEASYRSAAKRAAVRAMLAIDPVQALTMLQPLIEDPDIDGVIRAANRRQGR